MHSADCEIFVDTSVNSPTTLIWATEPEQTSVLSSSKIERETVPSSLVYRTSCRGGADNSPFTCWYATSTNCSLPLTSACTLRDSSDSRKELVGIWLATKVSRSVSPAQQNEDVKRAAIK